MYQFVRALKNAFKNRRHSHQYFRWQWTTALVGMLGVVMVGMPRVSMAVLEWHYLESTHFVLYYPKGLGDKAKTTLDALETHYGDVAKLTGHAPLRTPFILEHPGLLANGMANPVAYKSRVYVAPMPSHVPFTQYHHWARLLSVHEWTHLSHMTSVNHGGAKSQFVFGRLFSPNIYSPDWIIEGVAVLSESSLFDYEGRLNDAYTRAVIASKLKDGVLKNPVDLTNTLYSDYPYGATPYLMGGAFLRYMTEEYGPQVVRDIITEYGRHAGGPAIALRPDIGLDAAVKKITGRSLKAHGDAWIYYEKSQLQQWTFPNQKVTDDTSEKSFLTSYDGRLFYVQTNRYFLEPFYADTTYDVVAFDPKTNRSTTILSTTSPIISPLKFVGSTLYFNQKNVQSGFKNASLSTYGEVGTLTAFDLVTQKETPLFTKEMTCFAYVGQGAWMYARPAVSRFGSELWTYRHGRHQKVADLPVYVSEMDLFRGFIFAVAKKENGSWDIYKIDTQTFVPVNLTNTPWAETKMYQQGPYLYFCANKELEQKPYVMNLDTYKFFELSAISYTAFPVELDNTLYFISPTSRGDAVFKTTPSPKQATEWLSPKQDGMSVIPQTPKWSPNGISGSLKQSAPYARLIPPFFLGEDDIGLLDYSLLYTAGGSTVFSLTSRHLTPLDIQATYVNSNSDNPLSLSVSYPIYKRLTAGIQDITPSVIQTGDDTVLATRLGYKRSYYSAEGTVAYSTGTSGQVVDVTQRLYNRRGMIKCRVTRVDDVPYRSEYHVHPDVWLEDETETMVSLDISMPLFKYRKGELNPNIGINDIFLNAYYETSAFYDSTLFGLELMMESRAFFYLDLTPRVGVGLLNQEVMSYFRVGLML